MSDHRYEHAGEALSVRVTPLADGALEVHTPRGSHRVEVARTAPGFLAVGIDGRRLTAHVARAEGGGRLVALGGRVYRLRPPQRPGARRRGAEEPALCATMPAMVVEVRVAPGDEVAKGDVLLVLEAMKMAQELRAPYAGRVEAVRCAPGGPAEPGAPLVTLARAEASDAAADAAKAAGGA